MEGANCFEPLFGCNMTGLQLPIWAYPHGLLGSAIIGGFVYRGSELTELFGSYIYADFGSGIVWGLSFDANSEPVNSQLLQFNPFSIVSFGVDENNELLICSFDGRIYKIRQAEG